MTQQVADFFADTSPTARGLAHDAAVLRRPDSRDEGPVTAGRALRVGLVCPYSFEAPGGVQNHVLGLARHLVEQGHGLRAGSRRARPPSSGARHRTLHLRRGGRRGPLQRIRGPGELRPAECGPGPPLAAGRQVRPAAHPRTHHSEHLAARPVGRRTAGGRDLPHRDPAIPLDAAGRRRAARRRSRRSTPGSRSRNRPGTWWSSTSAGMPW